MPQRDKSHHRTTQEILDTLTQHREMLRKMGVDKIGLFGSYSRGTPTDESDMDFLVVLQQPSFDMYMDTKFFLEDLFLCKVDLVLESTLKPRLRPYILAEVKYVSGLQAGHHPQQTARPATHSNLNVGE